MFRDTPRRLLVACVVTLFLVVAPSATAVGLSDVAFELPDLSQIWVKISALWSGEPATRPAVTRHELLEKMGPTMDPVGDDGGETSPQQAPATMPSPLTETNTQQPPASAP